MSAQEEDFDAPVQVAVRPRPSASDAYAKLLDTPDWRLRRDEIKNRDGYQCQLCHCTNKPLDVHHLIYIDRLKPWEYPDYLLRTLCFECHKEEHLLWQFTDLSVTVALRAMGAGNSELSKLTQLLNELRRHHPDPAGWVTSLITDIDDDVSRCRDGHSPRSTYARH